MEPSDPGAARISVVGLRPRLDAVYRSTDELCRFSGLNTGNLVYAYAIDKHLDRDGRVLDFGVDPRVLNATTDVAVVQGANQLGTHFDAQRLAERFGRYESRIVVLGLGAQSDMDMSIPALGHGTTRWLRCIADRSTGDAPNVGVRGDFTRRVLGEYGMGGHAEVIGCPSLFIHPDPALGRRIKGNVRRPRRVAVVAGHYAWSHLRSIEIGLGRLVTETAGTYVGQHGLGMMMFTRGEGASIERSVLAEIRDNVCPQMELDAFVDWGRRYGSVFFDVESWIEYMRRFDFVVGLRIHGIMVALQAGVPALCIAHDSRTLELCQTMKVPYVRADDLDAGVSLDELLGRFRFEAEAFDANRRALATRYVELLLNNGVSTSSWISALVDDHAVRRAMA